MAATMTQTHAVAGARVRSFLGRRVAAPTNGVRVVARAGNWLPGSDFPAYLEKAPGAYGFDPLGLAKEPAALQRYQEAELVHCRWAMLGVAGCLGAEVLGQGDWYAAPQWAVTGGNATYFGVPVPFDLGTLAAVEFAMMAAAESQRGNEPDAEKRKYPGGAFDPLGFSKDPANFEKMKLREIKNGRLAMIAFLGFVGQHYANGLSPIAALGKHLESPFTNNFAENSVSLPYL